VVRIEGAGVRVSVGTGVVPSGDPDGEFMNVKAPAIIMTTMMARAAIVIRDVLFRAGGGGVNGEGPGGREGGADPASGDPGETGESVVERTGHLTSGIDSGSGASAAGTGAATVSWRCCVGIGDCRDGIRGAGTVRGTESSIKGSIE